MKLPSRDYFKTILKSFIITSLLVMTFSCSYRPILDQNDRYLQTSKEETEGNIEKCTSEADAYLKQYKARRAAKQAARKGALGAIFGGIFGFVFGGNSKPLLKGLAVGAGVGAVVGGLSVVGEGKLTPDQIKQNYVTNCLGKQGYSVIGWE